MLCGPVGPTSLCCRDLDSPSATHTRRKLCPSTPFHSCHPCQVRRLALALACTFHPRHFEDLERQLGDEEQWAVDEELLAAVQAVAGLAYA